MIGGSEPGQTPLDPDEADALLLPVVNRDGLNIAEAENIAVAMRWLRGRRPTSEVVLSEAFLCELHRRMLGRVWRWAGEFRRTDKNLGVPWFEIPSQVRLLLQDSRAWIESDMARDEVPVRFAHRLVSVHPFVNGNGRHSRLVADQLALALGRPVLTWGGREGLAENASDRRQRYLTALRAADAGDIEPLMAFAREA